jgi:hypothetical protein
MRAWRSTRTAQSCLPARPPGGTSVVLLLRPPTPGHPRCARGKLDSLHVRVAAHQATNRNRRSYEFRRAANPSGSCIQKKRARPPRWSPQPRKSPERFLGTGSRSLYRATSKAILANRHQTRIFFPGIFFSLFIQKLAFRIWLIYNQLEP